MRARQLGATAETIVDLADDVDPERDHVRGRIDAPVTLLEYGDFECPYCGHAAPIIAELLEHLGDDAALRLPPPAADRRAPERAARGRGGGGRRAPRAASGRCTTGCSPTRTRSPRRTSTATPPTLGLDLDRFSEDLRRRRHAPRVAEDVRSADASGVSGTPTFFINGRRHQGVYDVDTLTRAVKAAAQTAIVRS